MVEPYPSGAFQDTGNEATSDATGGHLVTIEEGGANATQAPALCLTIGAMIYHRVKCVLTCVYVFSAHQDGCPI